MVTPESRVQAPVRGSDEHPRVQPCPRPSKEWSGGGAGMGAPNAGPKTGRAGLDEAVTSPCTHRGGLAGVGCSDSEGRVDQVSVLKDTRGLAKKGGNRKLKWGAGSVVWERTQLNAEKAPEGAQRAVTPPPGGPPGFSSGAEGGLTGFSVTRGHKLLANTIHPSATQEDPGNRSRAGPGFSARVGHWAH